MKFNTTELKVIDNLITQQIEEVNHLNDLGFDTEDALLSLVTLGLKVRGGLNGTSI